MQTRRTSVDHYTLFALKQKNECSTEKKKTLKSITEIPVSNVTSYNVVREIVGAT
jgi:hypothetical protein